MAKNTLVSEQVRDGQVKRADLCVGPGNSGSTVIAKILQGLGISLSSTGTDAGTGDVTITNSAVFESLQNLDIGGPITIAARAAVATRSTGRITRASAAAVSGLSHRMIGFTTAAIVDSALGQVQTSGLLDGFSGLTATKRYFLDTGLGGIMPETSLGSLSGGQYVIPVGWAISTTKLLIQIGEPVLIA
jgi:hypothetical protein